MFSRWKVLLWFAGVWIPVFAALGEADSAYSAAALGDVDFTYSAWTLCLVVPESGSRAPTVNRRGW